VSVEKSIMENLFNLHGSSYFFDTFFSVIASYSTHVFASLFLIITVCLVYYKLKLNKSLYLSSLLLLPGVLLVNHVIRFLVARERPFAVDEEFTSLIYHYYTGSFPSNHAAASFAVAGILLLVYPAAGWGVLGMALLVSVSRVYVGVHYPTDVLAGAVLAFILLFFYIRYRNSLERFLQNVWEKVRNNLSWGARNIW